MQNQTEFTGMGISVRVEHWVRSNRGLLRRLGCGALAFFFAGSPIFGDISPFGMAFLAAMPTSYTGIAAVGAGAGYLLSPVVAGNLKYLAAILLLCALRFAFGTGSLWKRRVISSPLVAAICLGIPSFGVSLATGAYLYSLALSFSETVLASASAYFFARTGQTIQLGVRNADRGDLLCLLVSFGLLVTALGRVELLGLSLGRIIAVVVVLMVAGSGEGAGSAAGVCAGITGCLMGRDYGFLLGSYAIGGLMAGVFSAGGRVAQGAAFLVTAAIAGIMAPTQALMFSALGEAVVGSVIYLLLPQQLLEMARMPLHRPGEKNQEEQMTRELVLSRLGRMAEGLVEIGTTTRRVSEKLDKYTRSDPNVIYSRVAEQVCAKCSLRSRCWYQQYEKTMDAINGAMSQLKQGACLTRGMLPSHFISGCSHPDEFVSALNREYTVYQQAAGTRRKVSQVRSVVTDQFEGMALLLTELSQELGQITSRDSGLSAKVLEYLKNHGLEPESASCICGEEGRMTVEAVIGAHKLPRLDQKTAALDLGDLCDRAFELPTVETLGQKAVLTFIERAVFTVRYGVSQLVEAGSPVSGDAQTTFSDHRGYSYAILSDGMGSGGGAAVDSAMTCGLLTRLIQAGVGMDAALKMVNSALLVKSGEESLATVDVVVLNLYTGRADFYKAGAAPTFLLRGGRVGYVESASLPAGILQGVAFEKSSMTFREGDRILLVSDGVTATGVDWLPSQLESLKDRAPQEMAQVVAQVAKDRSLPGRDDDITVVVIELQRGH